ncbi:hypothetical protein MTO96_039900 [Rhipicephalus appendiculatus]
MEAQSLRILISQVMSARPGVLARNGRSRSRSRVQLPRRGYRLLHNGREQTTVSNAVVCYVHRCASA